MRGNAVKTNIWILNHYAGGMLFDRGGRHYNFAKYLKRAGYAPVVFCANAQHGKPERHLDTDALWTEQTAEEIGTPFVFVKARTYTGNGKQRVLNMIDFYRNVKKTAKEYAKEHGKPDVILASSVHPLTLVAGIQLAKHFGVKCICEVRDLWPESIVAYSKRFTKENPLIRLLYRGEKWIYKKADAVVFTMEGAYDYIVEQGWEKDIPRSKVHYINNGVDLEQFDYNKEHYTVDDPDLDDPDTFKLAFLGTLVVSNNIDGMLDLAKRLARFERLRLLIYGGGICTESMLRRIRDEQISNVLYKGWVDKKYVPSIVSRMDINFMHAAPTYLYRFGASPNKLFDYLAAGKPILQDFTYSGDIVQRYECGLACTWDIDAIEALVQQLYCAPPEERTAMGQRARNAAEAYDFRVLTAQLLNIIEDL